MDLNKFKAENFWLRAGLTIVILVWLSSLGVMNRGIITERQTLTDSISRLNVKLDSTQDELFNEKVESGRHELTRDEFFKKHSNLENEYNQYYEHETE